MEKSILSRTGSNNYVKNTYCPHIFNHFYNSYLTNQFEIIKIKNELVMNKEPKFYNFRNLILFSSPKNTYKYFTYNQAINMIWYFSDKTLNNDYKIISDNKIEYIFNLIVKLKNSEIDVEQIKLYDLIGIYKSCLYDTRNEILLRQKKYIYKTIYSLCNSYDIKIYNSNYEDYESEIKYYLLKVIDRINLNIEGQIIKYIDLTVKGYFRMYLKKYRKQINTTSLDDAKYLSDKGTRKEKSKLDYIADTNNSFKDNESNSFSSNMMKVLSTLSSEDLSFVMLKYQENYSDEELAQYFKLTLDEVSKKENEIISLLKNNDNVKVLIKSKD